MSRYRKDTLKISWWSPTKDSFPKELGTSQRSCSFKWEIIPDWTFRYLYSKASQPLTSLYPANTKVTSAVPMSISGFKVPHVKGHWEKSSDNNLGHIQTEAILYHVRLGRARRIRSIKILAIRYRAT
ncbi:hypothetical protein TNCV_4432111 [Trichonephila clavipes]|nr:hypothetical protein TNCV_4432111 [Trichonephila clavipes]